MRNLLVIGMIIVTALACGKKKKASVDTGTAKAALSRRPSAPLTTATGTTEAATAFAMKITSIQLMEDVDASGAFIGNNATIYASSVCKTQADANGIISAQLGPGACPIDQVAYLDLARDAAAVNADLNAQNATVPAGTYKFIQVTLNGTDTPTKPTVKYQGAGMTAPMEYISGIGAAAGAAAAAVTIAKGDTVLVSIGYDLSTAVAIDAGFGNSVCGGTQSPSATTVNGHIYGLCFPTLTPTFTKQ